MEHQADPLAEGRDVRLPYVLSVTIDGIAVVAIVVVIAICIMWFKPTSTVSTQYFTIELPKGWQIERLTTTPDEYGQVNFEILCPESTSVFNVTVAADAPRFLACFCSPWEDYRQYEKDGVRFADLTLGESKHRTLKAVGKSFGTDVHLSYGNFDKATLDRMVESIHPF